MRGRKKDSRRIRIVAAVVLTVVSLAACAAKDTGADASFLPSVQESASSGRDTAGDQSASAQNPDDSTEDQSVSTQNQTDSSEDQSASAQNQTDTTGDQSEETGQLFHAAWGDFEENHVLSGLLPSSLSLTDGTFRYAPAEQSLSGKGFCAPMFYGTWVLRDGDTDRNHQTKLPKEEDSFAGLSTAMFPDQMALGFGFSGTEGPAPYRDGLYFGEFIYGYQRKDDGQSGQSLVTGIYTADEATLAVGLTGLKQDDLLEGAQDTESPVIEIDYGISWTGAVLTLSHGKEEAVYVPSWSAMR